MRSGTQELQSSASAFEPKQDTIERICAWAQAAAIERTTTSALVLTLAPSVTHYAMENIEELSALALSAIERSHADLAT